MGRFTNNAAATYEYNIPTCIPDGEYLLRIQSLAIHNPGSPPQFYISCAQVNVTGGGSTTPSPTAKFPGAVHADDPGYTANVSSKISVILPLPSPPPLLLEGCARKEKGVSLGLGTAGL